MSMSRVDERSIEQMAQDLAFAKYAERTQTRYLQTAKRLAAHSRKPLIEVTREDLRAFVETVHLRGKSATQVSAQLCAVLFLFRETPSPLDLLPQRR